jgi:hypothetical protein
LLQGGDLKGALEKLRTARGHIPRDVPDKAPTIDRDLFLLTLALSQIELGGSEDDALSKLKLSWKEDALSNELRQTLELIKAPEARVWAMREVASRLLEKGQPRLAIGLASRVNDIVVAGRKPMESQIIALAVATDDKNLLEGDQLPKAPEPGKESKDASARIGYAEGYARKERFKDALDIAAAPGPLRDKLEAYVGTAAVILSKGYGKAAAEEAKPFLEDALKTAKAMSVAAAQKKGPAPSPWLVLHLIRLGSHVEALKEEVEKLPASLPAEFRRRAELELFLAKCDVAKEPVSLPAAEEFGKDEVSIALALEAAARQHSWCGESEEVVQHTAEGEIARYRLLAKLGLALGQHFRRNDER